ADPRARPAEPRTDGDPALNRGNHPPGAGTDEWADAGLHPGAGSGELGERETGGGEARTGGSAGAGGGGLRARPGRARGGCRAEDGAGTGRLAGSQGGDRGSALGDSDAAGVPIGLLTTPATRTERTSSRRRRASSISRYSIRRNTAFRA